MNTWEKVAAPIVLEKLNWTGEVRKDRPIKKGVRKLNITKVILGNSFYELYVIMASNIRLNLGAVRSNKAFSSLTDSDFAEYTKQALRRFRDVSTEEEWAETFRQLSKWSRTKGAPPLISSLF